VEIVNYQAREANSSAVAPDSTTISKTSRNWLKVIYCTQTTTTESVDWIRVKWCEDSFERGAEYVWERKTCEIKIAKWWWS